MICPTCDGDGVIISLIDSEYISCPECGGDGEIPEIIGLDPDGFYLEDDEIPQDQFCPHCGKLYEDFSDYGCEYCDRRVSPGIIP